MSHLLDTHAFLWFINDDKSLSQAAKAVIEDPANTIYLSVASVWEMAIKVRLGKLEMPLPFLDFMTEQMRRNSRLRLLGINIEHADIVASLPLYHRDPFDRMISRSPSWQSFRLSQRIRPSTTTKSRVIGKCEEPLMTAKAGSAQLCEYAGEWQVVLSLSPIPGA